MRKNLMSIILSGLAITSFGQIVITNDDIAPVGTTVFMANDSLPADEIVPGEAGADKSWDFTNVAAHTIDTVDFVLPASTPYAEEFPEANFALAGDSFYVYTIRNADKLVRTGMAVTADFGDTLFMHVDPEDILLDFPVTYEDTYDETYVVDYKIESPEPGADSVRIKNTVVKATNVDAWGTLTIPMGTYDALRQRVDEVNTDSIFAKVFGNWIFISASQDSSTNYSWWTDDVNIGFELFEMDVDRVSGDVTYVSFMNSLPVGLFENIMIASRAFPNPVSDVLNIEFEEAQTGELTLLNQLGQVVFSEKLGGQKRIQINLSQHPVGIYLYTLRNTSGEVVGSGKVLKR